jgi:hypothetical protein
MINRAKCKLCNKIIELKEIDGLESCDCGEIAFEYRNKGHIAICKRIENLVAIDDEGNEIVVTTVNESLPTKNEVKHNRNDLLKILDKMIKDYEELPQSAMSTYITQYDMMSALMLVSEIFKVKE